MTSQEFRRLALSFPEVFEGAIWGTRIFEFEGRFSQRWAIPTRTGEW
jgi:hypothetical protein